MAYITWPTSGRAFAAARFEEGLGFEVEKSQFRSGRVTTDSLPGALWGGTLQIAQDDVGHMVERGQIEAFLTQLRGGAVRLRLWSLARPTPLGTLTGSPTVATQVNPGAVTVDMTNCNGTLLRGDRIQLGTGGQRVMVVADATPSGGNMTVSFEPAARLTVSAAAAIIWDKPWTSYIRVSTQDRFPYEGTRLPGFSIELLEGAEA